MTDGLTLTGLEAGTKFSQGGRESPRLTDSLPKSLAPHPTDLISRIPLTSSDLQPNSTGHFEEDRCTLAPP